VLRQTLVRTIQTLQAAGCDNPQLDARLLLQTATGLDHSELIIAMDHPITTCQQSQLTTMVKRRSQREPMAYILGYRDFWKHRFHTDPRALIPRPETEHLIEALLTYFPDHNQPLHLCDIATGSGCIAISIASEYPNATVVATDLSTDALLLAQQNCQQHALSDRISFFQGNLFDALPQNASPFNAIISNPPYVSSDEMTQLAPELDHEPQMALTDGKNGLTILNILLSNAHHYLADNDYLMVETGSCGLPPQPTQLTLQQEIIDLAGLLRGGVYQKNG